MATILAAAGDFRIVRNDNDTVSVHMRADKIPNQYGYGHTFESGNITRAWARKMARKYLSPASLERINVGACIGTSHVGSDLYREYLVSGVQNRTVAFSTEEQKECDHDWDGDICRLCGLDTEGGNR